MKFLVYTSHNIFSIMVMVNYAMVSEKEPDATNL